MEGGSLAMLSGPSLVSSLVAGLAAVPLAGQRFHSLRILQFGTSGPGTSPAVVSTRQPSRGWRHPRRDCTLRYHFDSQCSRPGLLDHPCSSDHESEAVRDLVPTVMDYEADSCP